MVWFRFVLKSRVRVSESRGQVGFLETRSITIHSACFYHKDSIRTCKRELFSWRKFYLHFFCVKMIFFIPGGDWWDFSIGEKHFQFSSWYHLITEWAKGEPCNKTIVLLHELVKCPNVYWFTKHPTLCLQHIIIMYSTITCMCEGNNDSSNTM